MNQSPEWEPRKLAGPQEGRLEEMPNRPGDKAGNIDEPVMDQPGAANGSSGKRESRHKTHGNEVREGDKAQKDLRQNLQLSRGRKSEYQSASPDPFPPLFQAILSRSEISVCSLK